MEKVSKKVRFCDIVEKKCKGLHGLDKSDTSDNNEPLQKLQFVSNIIKNILENVDYFHSSEHVFEIPPEMNKSLNNNNRLAEKEPYFEELDNENNVIYICNSSLKSHKFLVNFSLSCRNILLPEYNFGRHNFSLSRYKDNFQSSHNETEMDFHFKEAVKQKQLFISSENQVKSSKQRCVKVQNLQIKQSFILQALLKETEFKNGHEANLAFFKMWCEAKYMQRHQEEDKMKTESINTSTLKNVAKIKPNLLPSSENFKKRILSKNRDKIVPFTVSKKLSQNTDSSDECKMAYKCWKDKKDTEIKKNNMAKKSLEAKRMLKIAAENVKKKDAESAFAAWKSLKDKELKIKKLNNTFETDESKKSKDKDAMAAYNLWLESKFNK